jgi:hypothetical protein
MSIFKCSSSDRNVIVVPKFLHYQSDKHVITCPSKFQVVLNSTRKKITYMEVKKTVSVCALQTCRWSGGLKFTLEQAGEAQRESRGITILLL